MATDPTLVEASRSSNLATNPTGIKTLGGSGDQAVAEAPKFSKRLNDLLKLYKEKNLPIYVMLEESVVYEIRLNRQGNKLVATHRQLSEDMLEHFKKEKIEVLSRTHSLWIGCFQGALAVMTPALPQLNLFGNISQQMATNIGQGIGNALGSVNDRFKSQDESDRTGHQHMYDMYSALKQDHSQNLNNGKQHFRELDGVIEKIVNFMQQLFSRLYSAS